MARKVKDYTVVTKGRDHGKVFRLTEMSAFKAERWALRALQSLVAAGVDLPDDLDTAPLATMVQAGIKALAKIPFEKAEPLLEEMMECVSFIPNPQKPNVIRPLFEEDIEEPSTIIVLRKEVVSLHISFFTED